MIVKTRELCAQIALTLSFHNSLTAAAKRTTLHGLSLIGLTLNV